HLSRPVRLVQSTGGGPPAVSLPERSHPARPVPALRAGCVVDAADPARTSERPARRPAPRLRAGTDAGLLPPHAASGPDAGARRRLKDAFPHKPPHGKKEWA